MSLKSPLQGKERKRLWAESTGCPIVKVERICIPKELGPSTKKVLCKKRDPEAS